ncbi:tRNA-dihydrouridine synthase A [Methylomarinovum tepidoasis]|uniref:tRNA-dihydrouridine(20/20a) synthase n=1 Tax=Methylomarinovum tepidoasis TaxID=2840183 RepID=A0AAU9C7B2_9GAMM|nr:tRNA dihydrouridine(20/20a) synthase DusA [Methylomarinovum sp. IN45]BCX89149.1 tRNA-dihydrouridine synthase A [Methylomarinovum sp. IN45]
MSRHAVLSVAPMLEWTDRHFRYFLRLLTEHTLLYTEMVTCGALLHGDAARILAFDARERPLVLQLGGSDPRLLARAVRIADACGFAAYNLNVGCPSDRVQEGRFGACLMREPERVAELVAAMRAVTRLPVSVKCRIGVDERDRYDDLAAFVATVAQGGCDTFIVHARKAWLKGLSPKENRTVPPLRYELVHRLKQDFPGLTIVLNGGIDSLDQAAAHLAWVDGVMIGRAAYHNPYLLAEADRRFFGGRRPPPSREDVLRAYLPYVRKQLAAGVRLHAMTRHLLGLYHGQPGARRWRRHLSGAGSRAGAGIEVLSAWLARQEAVDGGGANVV